MKQICDTCNEETSGFLIKINGESFFVCSECKQYSTYEPPHKPKTPLFIMKGNGWHSTDYA
jgi:ribosome-binding protein aMBF1 (putative translation factor)